MKWYFYQASSATKALFASYTTHACCMRSLVVHNSLDIFPASNKQTSGLAELHLALLNALGQCWCQECCRRCYEVTAAAHAGRRHPVRSEAHRHSLHQPGVSGRWGRSGVGNADAAGRHRWVPPAPVHSPPRLGCGQPAQPGQRPGSLRGAPLLSHKHPPAEQTGMAFTAAVQRLATRRSGKCQLSVIMMSR